MSELVRTTPSLRDRLPRQDADAAREGLAALAAEPETRPFVDAFRAYLDQWGWRSGGEFAEPTWAEDPGVPLAILRAYLEAEGYDHAAEQRRLAEERDAAIKQTMAGLDEHLEGKKKRLEEKLERVNEELGKK